MKKAELENYYDLKLTKSTNDLEDKKMKNNFLRIKFNDAGDESLSHTLKAYNLIDKLLEKTDHKYAYDIDVKDIKGNTVVDINMKLKLNN